MVCAKHLVNCALDSAISTGTNSDLLHSPTLTQQDYAWYTAFRSVEEANKSEKYRSYHARDRHAGYAKMNTLFGDVLSPVRPMPVSASPSMTPFKKRRAVEFCLVAGLVKCKDQSTASRESLGIDSESGTGCKECLRARCVFVSASTDWDLNCAAMLAQPSQLPHA